MQIGFNIKTDIYPVLVFEMTIVFSSSTDLGYNEGDKKIPAANAAAELFHYHPSCNTKTRTSVSSDFTLFTNFITQEEEDVLRKELDPHLKRLKYEFDHWDDVRKCHFICNYVFLC